MTTLTASDHNPDDLRRRESPVFMSGNLPPDVPEIFDARYGAALDAVRTQRSPSRLIGAHQYRGSDRDRAAGAAFTARRLGTTADPVPGGLADPDRAVVTVIDHGRDDSRRHPGVPRHIRLGDLASADAARVTAAPGPAARASDARSTAHSFLVSPVRGDALCATQTPAWCVRDAWPILNSVA
ncbi:hypothetical protein [Streptomyces scopuliridis]|uniref:hypothetical protein n=1 Tax=Streptomyces scopuliridis TaxID=452529 RepID=UPI0036CB52AA